jgi:hypothetical protein
MEKKIITSFSGYLRFLNESESYDPQEIQRKINRVILWISINKGFYGELLSHVNIYGSSDLDPKTMATNGRDIIFHPEFVQRQSEAALRFVLAHEILHCIGDHMTRRENRNPVGWNIACDYAINPLLKGEEGMEWPIAEDGSREGLYDERFEGMRAEDIYDFLQESGELDKLMADPKVVKSSEVGEVLDDTSETPESDPGLEIQEGDFPIDSTDDQEGEEGEGQDGEGQDGEEGEGEEGEGQDGEGQDGEGEEGEGQDGEGEEGEGQEGEGDGSPLPRAGQEVITKDGKTGIISKVYPNGDIEIY